MKYNLIFILLLFLCSCHKGISILDNTSNIIQNSTNHDISFSIHNDNYLMKTKTSVQLNNSVGSLYFYVLDDEQLNVNLVLLQDTSLKKTPALSYNYDDSYKNKKFDICKIINVSDIPQTVYKEIQADIIKTAAEETNRMHKITFYGIMIFCVIVVIFIFFFLKEIFKNIKARRNKTKVDKNYKI